MSMKHRQFIDETSHAAPVSDFEWMMQAFGDHFVDSTDHIDLVAAVVDRLPENLRDVINAVYAEQTPFSELAERLGCSKTQAWRRTKAALAAVRREIETSPAITRRFNVYDTWNDASEAIIRSLDRTMPRPALIGTIEHCARSLAADVRDGNDLSPMQFTVIGTEAVGELKSRGLWQPEAFHALLCSKQADYGHQNILAFGTVGVAVRMHDKVARLLNLTSRNAGPLNEPLLDTWLDLIGYSVIAEMLHNNTFTLELEHD